MGFLGFFETLFGFFESFFKKLFDDGPAWVQTASTVIAYVSPLLETLIGLVAGAPTELAAQALIGKVESDLQTVLTFLTDAGSNEANIESTLQSVLTNLNAFEAEVGIKDAATADKVKVAVTTIIQEVEAILKSLPKAAAQVRADKAAGK